MTVAMPAVDIDKLNRLSEQVTMLYNEYFLEKSLDQHQLNQLSGELKKFSNTPCKATAFAQLGSIYFMKKDLTNMMFNYKTAIRFEPQNELIRYNFASALYASNKHKLAIKELTELIPHITQISVLIDTYKLLERELQIPKCREIIKMIATAKELANNFAAENWLSERGALLSAYQELNIDLSVLSQLFDELNKTLRPKFPVSVDVKHYYEEIDNTIYYVFIDKTSDADKAFENCMALVEFVSDFETKHNVDLKHFVIDYDGVKS